MNAPQHQYPQQAPGDLYQQELLTQADPEQIARINAYARQTGLKLNWNLPLRAMSIQANSGVINRTEVVSAQSESARFFVLKYQFPVASYLIGINCVVRSGVFSTYAGAVVIPPAAYNTQIDWNDYVDFQLVRTNNEIYTGGTDSGYTTASSWMGKYGNAADSGKFPMTQFITPSETLVLNGRMAPELYRVNDIRVQINYLQLPIGNTV